MHPILKLNVQMSRVRQPNRSPIDNRASVQDKIERLEENDDEGRMEMLHLHSEAIVNTPSS